MTEAWSSYAEQRARSSISANGRPASVIALPFGHTVGRDRLVRGVATTVTAFAAFLGVLIVSAAAVILGLT